MATGDITACRILAMGWEAEIDIEGLAVGGTYTMDGSGSELTDRSTAKVVFTVVSEGYAVVGGVATLGTKTRTVYGAVACPKADPNQAQNEESYASGTLTVRIALSDPVYDDDDLAGNGVADPTVTISAGFYTEAPGDGGTANNATSSPVTVTNNSALDYPKVIARWAVVPYQRVTSTIDLEVVAFHYHAEYGQPVACVVFSHTDAATDAVAVSRMVQSSAADALPCYRRTITASSYTDNTSYDWQFTAYPWIGDDDSKLTTVGGSANALTLGALPLYMDSNDDARVYIACVNVDTGVDSGIRAFTDYASAAASPCATVRYALAQVHAGGGGSTADHCLIYLQSDDHSWGDGTGTGTTTNGWVTVTRDPYTTSSKADAKIVGHPNGTMGTAHLRLRDITLVHDGTTYMLTGSSGRVLWMDEVDVASVSEVTDGLSRLYDLLYVTHCTSSNHNAPWQAVGGVNVCALVRGSTSTNCSGYGAGGYGARCVLTSTVNAINTASGYICDISATNTIVAYSKCLVATGSPLSGQTTVAGDVAIVCNVLERITTGTVAELWGAGSVDTSNVLIWHNTCAGGRVNLAYNWTTKPLRTLFSVKFNAFERICLKDDDEAGDPTYINSRSLSCGVGWMGNHQENVTTEFVKYYQGINWSLGSSADYTDDQSFTTAGSGNGNYVPAAGSVLRNKIPTATDVVIPWDIMGRPYRSGGSAGAYSNGPGGKRFWWGYS